jgi:oligopeptide/dipeptide ABC transporter ATP-binding protein
MTTSRVAPSLPGAMPVAGEKAPASLLSLQCLSVHFHSKRGRIHAVDDVSLEIRDGETIGLVGETGSGKTITARALLRLVPEPPGIYAGGKALFHPKRACPACSGSGCVACEDTGKVDPPCTHCQGQGCPACGHTGQETVDLLGLSENQMRRIRGNNISMVFQDPGKALNPTMTIRAQLSEVFAEHGSEDLLRAAGLLSKGARGRPHAGHLLRRSARGRTTFAERRMLQLPPWRRSDRRLQRVLDDRIAAALADTNIPNPRQIMASYPHELSGGMRQRVMIAQALSCDPDLLIADEPTTALDVTIQARILDLIQELQARHHTAVLYISHDLSLVRDICDRVAVMYAGQLVEVGTTEEIFANPLHPYTRGLLAATPAAGQRRGELVAIEGNVPELVDPADACRFATRCGLAARACHRHSPELAQPKGQHSVACLLYGTPSAIGAVDDDMPREKEPS